jgi:hypothetical protein
MAKQFDGKGYDQSDFKEHERAELRHLYRVMDENFVPIDENTLQTMKDGTTLVQGVKILGQIIKIGGPVTLAGLMAGAFAKSQGWL